MQPIHLLRLPLAAAALALLAACSGGGDTAPAAEAAVPAAPSLRGAVALGSPQAAQRGLVAGAQVCLDVDGNGGCDPGEPMATTAADGSFVLAASAASGAALVAELSAGVQVDGAPLGRAVVLRAPAGSGLLSPLSTLVVAEMALSGEGAEVVAARLAERGGVALLADFRGADGAPAARLSWLTEQTLAEQRAALAAPVAAGQLQPADVERESLATLVAALRELAAEAAGADAGTPQVLAARLGPTRETVLVAVRMAALAAPPPPAVPQASSTLQVLRYVDANNWFMRAFQSSAADNTPDAGGLVRYHDVYARSASPSASMPAGIVERWTGGPSSARAGDLHWTGSTWRGCDLSSRYTNTGYDAAGRSEFDYCNGREQGRVVRRYEDISGLDMVMVLRDKIRSFPGGVAGVQYRDFGPADLGLLAGRSFPAGSYLHLQVNTPTASAWTYDPRTANRVQAYPVSVAAGGDTRVTPGLACADTGIAVVGPVATLEDLVVRAPGRPCVFGPGGVTPDLSLDPNEWWGNSTLFVGELFGFNPLPAGTGAYYDTRALLRVAFRGADRALFYNCYRRSSDGSARNCSLIGLGKYRIETVGDARVLSFTTMPAVVQRLGYDRVYVERGGVIYYGWRNRVGVAGPQLRLGHNAARALLDALGMPRIAPVRQPGTATGADAAALATARGAWGEASDTTATVLRFGADGRFFLAEAKPPEAFLREQSGAELGWFDIDVASGKVSALLEVDSNLTAGFSNSRDDDRPITITADRIGDDGGFSVGRLRDDLGTAPLSLVGLWAQDSATELRVPHLALFANGRGMAITHDAVPDAECFGGDAPGECPPGVEFFEYSFDPVSGELRLFNPQYDTNGCGGFFNRCPTAVSFGDDTTEVFLSITPAGDGRSFEFLDFSDTLRTFHRVPPRP